MKPFAADAIMNPLRPVVKSLILTSNACCPPPMLASVEPRELQGRPGGAVQHDHRGPGRVAHHLIRQPTAVGQPDLRHGADR